MRGNNVLDVACQPKLITPLRYTVSRQETASLRESTRATNMKEFTLPPEADTGYTVASHPDYGASTCRP